jgi:uncharacterized damage-inducible protein DinB
MIRESLLPEFDRELAVTRAVLARMPDEALDWKPHPKSFSLGELATHVVNVPTWVATTVDADGVDLAAPFTPPVPGDRETLLRRLDANVATARAKIAGADDRTLMAPWSLRTGDLVHFTMPKAAVLRTFVMNHLIHHRAQLCVYLRLLDVPVPAVYGPSADEQTA